MNKQDLIDFVASKTGTTKKDASNAVDAVFDGVFKGGRL
jgi:nucleoid DNA-binding protein